MKTFAFCFLMVFGCFLNSIFGQVSDIDAKQKIVKENINQFGKYHINTAIAYNDLGMAYSDEGDYKKTIKLYKKGLNINLKLLDEKHPNIATFYHNLGVAYSKMGSYEKAIEAYNKALIIDLEILDNKHPNIVDAYNNLGMAYNKIGDYEKAIDFFNKGLNIQLEMPKEDHFKVIIFYHNLGVAYQNIGNHQEAIDSYKKALDIEIEVSGKKHPNVIHSYNVLEDLYSKLSWQFMMAEEGIIAVGGPETSNINFELLDIRQKIFNENHPESAKSYIALGYYYYRHCHQYEKAIELYNKALNVQLEVFGEKHVAVAHSYERIGAIYISMNEYEKAIASYNKSLNIRLILPKKKGVTYTYEILGGLYAQIGNYQKALELNKKVLNIRRDLYGKNNISLVSSYNSLGIVHEKMGEYKKAIDLYNKASQIYRRYSRIHYKKVYAWENYNNLGRVYEKTGEYKKAIDLYNKALSNQYEGNEKSFNAIRTDLARIYGKIGNYKTADSLWHINIPKLGTLRFNPSFNFEYVHDIFNTFGFADFYLFAVTSGNDSTKQFATNLLLNTKSLSIEYITSVNQSIKKTNDSILTSWYTQLNILNRKLANVDDDVIKKEIDSNDWGIYGVWGEKEALTIKILQYSQLKPDIKTIQWQDIQNHLAPEEATIDFLSVYEKKDSLPTYYAVVIHKDLDTPQFMRITDEKTLTKLLETYEEEEHPRYLQSNKIRKALHKNLWQPLEVHLDGIKTVHISPSGILHRLPFESLQNEDDEYLATQYQFHYHSAIRDMLKEKPQKTIYKDMLLMGHILYNLDEKDKYVEELNDIVWADANRNIRGPIRPLPKTLHEVTEIDSISQQVGLKTTLLTIDAASEDTVQYFVGEHAPSIMHFATHGVFLPPLDTLPHNLATLTGSRDRLRAADNPLQRSALMLYGANETWTKGRRILGSGEDGILTALEVTALDLQNTDLVVLSACSTGLGNVHNTEGVFGLQRAFKLAGVDYVIASLWAVDDTATKELMVIFYENLLRKKQDPATALRNAKETLRKEDYRLRDWAGFILIE